jgi:hypothetical protein
MRIDRCISAAALLTLGLGMQGLSTAGSPRGTGQAAIQKDGAVASVHDFDFLIGRWLVHHRRLKERLAGSHEWVDFEGTLVTRKLMDGYANVGDNVFEVQGGAYRGVGLRAFDAKSRQWSSWWLDGRNPTGSLEPPLRGSFHDGVGAFYADDTFKGKPVRVRVVWSKITPTSCHWEQAYSPDGGRTWETNWLTDFKRAQ